MQQESGAGSNMPVNISGYSLVNFIRMAYST